MVERSIQSGKPEAHRRRWEQELECPPLPMALSYLWTAYKRIRGRKGGNGFGPSPIEGHDFESYERRYRFKFLPFENEILDSLDNLYIAAQNKSSNEDGEPEE